MNRFCTLSFYCIALIFNGIFIHAQTSIEQLKQFTLLESSKTGIHFNNLLDENTERNILLYDNFYGGAGVGIGDFNRDGLQDIYFAGNLVDDKLYLNTGDLKFEDASANSGLVHDGGWTTGVTVADVNNDGWPDIYLSRELYDEKPELRRNLLYINNGDATFTESAEQYGVADQQRTRHASFFDYNKDGFLDLILLTQPPNPGSYSKYSGTNLLRPEYHIKLYKNRGGNSFVEVSSLAGVAKSGYPNAVSTSDFNNDGWTDIYVANDFDAPDLLYINNQDGTFSNVIDEAMNHISFYSMGVDVADINNDGQLDIFTVDMAAEDNYRSKANMSGMNPDAFWKVVNDGGHYQYMYNTFQLSNGNGTYSDVAQLFGMAKTDWSWSNLIADFDNDGLKDTYVSNGLLRDIRNTDADKKVAKYVAEALQNYAAENPDDNSEVSVWDVVELDRILELIPSQPLKNYAYKNKDDLKFDKVTEAWGLDQESFSNGAAYADLDNDGDLDLVVNNINAEAFVYKNNAEQFRNANYLRVKLNSNAHKPVLGSRIVAYNSGQAQLLETTNVRGIYSTSEQTAHFGLGAATRLDSLVVIWPNSQKTTLKNLPANRELTLVMEEADASSGPVADQNESILFEKTEAVPIQLVHTENDYDDYTNQVLLPHKMSQFGPALAKGDVNNDGLEDLFFGGASGYAPRLFVQDEDGKFESINADFWDKENAFEDVDAVFFDVDGDGFQDLYVVSGGNEYPVNDFHYVDRIYLNDQKGNFKKGAIQNIGRDSGSAVRALDYDNDGDIDLFVGGRHWPHQYPLPASSMLLVNENNRLVNRTKELAPELENIGMVTDAVWSDIDGDGDSDLMLVGEWMPVTVFLNTNGNLKRTDTMGLGNSTGWWFAIEKGDFDRDGDEDFIVGNLGLNYKYQTSPEEPFDIYYNDFDGNGSYDIVLSYHDDDKHFPLRGFSCSSQQIPGLKAEIKQYDIFASLELDAIYGEKKLDKSLHYVADTFASVYLENTGDGSFEMHELPRMTQLSSINDLLVDDFDSDGNLDVLAVGNLFVSEIETPRNDAGTGMLLLGNGTGGFEPVSVLGSGFFANRDARKITEMQIGKDRFVLVANNDSEAQWFKLENGLVPKALTNR
ncbi:VCBS repeat-containing protein [Leeuwenhoekiella sp. H156]|uniref:VCBS repeat-containing protein n=1 Tax=Leeuwenhoekiella sp. H156 TaxID=3450128 RepID=UPI003FA4A783